MFPTFICVCIYWVFVDVKSYVCGCVWVFIGIFEFMCFGMFVWVFVAFWFLCHKSRVYVSM